MGRLAAVGDLVRMKDQASDLVRKLPFCEPIPLPTDREIRPPRTKSNLSGRRNATVSRQGAPLELCHSGCDKGAPPLRLFALAWCLLRWSCHAPHQHTPLSRHRSRLIAIASRSGALASHSACMMAFENSITRLTPREVRASTISYCSGDNSRCHLAKAGVYSYSYARSLLGVADKRLLVCKFPLRHRLSPTPVFLGFPFHRWRGGVLALDPVRRAALAGVRDPQINHQLTIPA